MQKSQDGRISFLRMNSRLGCLECPKSRFMMKCKDSPGKTTQDAVVAASGWGLSLVKLTRCTGRHTFGYRSFRADWRQIKPDLLHTVLALSRLIPSNPVEMRYKRTHSWIEQIAGKCSVETGRWEFYLNDLVTYIMRALPDSVDEDVIVNSFSAPLLLVHHDFPQI